MSLIGDIGSRLAWRYVAAQLRNRGWEVPDSPAALQAALEKLRDLLGSEAAVIASIEQPKVCGVPDCITLDARSPRWPANEITYGLAHNMTGLGADAWAEAHRLAWGTFEQVCGLKVSYSPNYKTAQVIIEVGRIDGASGTLAYSQLADGTMRAKGQKYDSSERWSTEEGGRGIYLPAVIRHEGGHAVGMPHLRQGAILQPTYDDALSTFTAIDIDYLQNTLGYGKPKNEPTPLPTPPEPELRIVLQPGQTLVVTRN